ncbi:putative tripartite motif-containing protein 49B [Bubalus bubalis]|uniref:putative tripartite motif-containing protein 49B n=1 Tax=Bubalus bubalis TaxID=89462 RepID=UPI001E1B8396|nr:putative tripartite motif-containing protein 49B [Bubalus bubalis]
MWKRGESVKLHLPWPVVRQLSAWPIPGLIDWLNQFQVYIALDNERVTPRVPVFEDLRCLLAGPDGPGVNNTSPRSKYFLAWGAESFTSDQCYWEVDVAGYCNWAIGFCNDCWERFLTQREFFYFFVSERTISAVSLPPPHCHLNMSKSLWVGCGCSWILTVVP